MTNGFDHTTDKNGSELFRLYKLYEFPEFVKHANMDETLRPENLAPTVYAHPSRRQFPCHNRASTWLSNLYFQEKKAEFDPKTASWIESRLNHYTEFHGIKGDVDRMKAAYDEMHKDADSKLPDSDFAFVWAGDDGHKIRKLRLKNALEVKAAAAWLREHRDELPFSDRHTIATKILEKQARYGASLGDNEQFIHRQAGHAICRPEDVCKMIRGRATLAKTASVRKSLLKLADTIAHKPKAALGPNELVKTATTIDLFDRTTGLVGKYSDTIPRPDDVIFSLTLKEARAAADTSCETTSGNVYDRGEFQRLKLADVRAMFGDGLARQISSGLDVDPEKIAEIASTLPRPDAELFDRLCDEAGIAPLRKTAAHVNRQALQKAAAAY